MTHAIFVRALHPRGSQLQVLAVDIDSLSFAAQIAEGIVGTYPMHGRDTATGAYWFINQQGLHELIVK